MAVKWRKVVEEVSEEKVPGSKKKKNLPPQEKESTTDWDSYTVTTQHHTK